MTLNEYQEHALETAVYPEKYKVVYPALGLAGEAGETADKIKKVLRGDDGVVLTDEKRQAVAMEIGDRSLVLRHPGPRPRLRPGHHRPDELCETQEPPGTRKVVGFR